MKLTRSLLLLLLGVAAAAMVVVPRSAWAQEEDDDDPTPAVAVWSKQYKAALPPASDADVDAVLAAFEERYGGEAKPHKNSLRKACKKRGDKRNKRAAALKSFVQSRLATGTSDTSFEALGKRVYAAFVKTVGIDDADWADTPGEKQYRANLLALATLAAAANNKQAGPDDYKMGLTHLSGLDPSEMLASFTGYKKDTTLPVPDSDEDEDAPQENVKNNMRGLQTLPASFDLRTVAGVVGAVRDQGGCGSCWAFAAVASMETGIALQKVGQPMDLSEEQIASCNPFYTPCGGGDASGAWLYVASKAPHGLVKESAYPYYSGLNCNAAGKCLTQPCKTGVLSQGVGMVNMQGKSWYKRYTTQTDIMTAVMNQGAVVMTLDASCLQNYNSGVIQSASCGCSNNANDVNHQVAIVGWASTSTNVPYWIVRNQWGADWGEKGYFRILRNNNFVNSNAGICGSNSESLFPLSLGVLGGASPTTQPPVAKPTTQPPVAKPTTQPPVAKPTTKPPVAKPTTRSPTRKPTRKPAPTRKPTPKPTVPEIEYEYEYEAPPTKSPTRRRRPAPGRG